MRPPVPSFQSIVIVYVVFVLFGFYVLYMFEPIAAHRLFSTLFNPLI